MYTVNDGSRLVIHSSAQGRGARHETRASSQHSQLPGEQPGRFQVAHVPHS